MTKQEQYERGLIKTALDINKYDIFHEAQKRHVDERYISKQLIQKKVCMTKDIGVNNNLFGGYLLQWIDEAAAGHVYEAIGFKPIVTLKMSEVLFKAPVKVGEIINIDGTITKIGNSSITIYIQVSNTNTGQEVCSTEIVFVKIDENGKPKEIQIRYE